MKYVSNYDFRSRTFLGVIFKFHNPRKENNVRRCTAGTHFLQELSFLFVLYKKTIGEGSYTGDVIIHDHWFSR